MSMDKNIRILIAEDDYLVSEEISRVLKSKGYKSIEMADNGLEAVKLVCHTHPDVVLMDIQMPELDGLEAARQIQECCPTPVIILTAHESKEFIDQASEAGVAAYLTKPPKPGEIESAITIALARHADLMELRRLNKELQKALSEINTLRGIIPICANCKRIRNDKGYWEKIESYISKHSDADFSHGICPECARKLYPDYFEEEN